jgi:hypothetical protein
VFALSGSVALSKMPMQSYTSFAPCPSTSGREYSALFSVVGVVQTRLAAILPSWVIAVCAVAASTVSSMSRSRRNRKFLPSRTSSSLNEVISAKTA